MLRKITLHVAVFRRVEVRGILGVTNTLSFDRVEDKHFWFDEDCCGAMRPADAVMRAMNFHMHSVDFMKNTSMLTGWKTEAYAFAVYEDAMWKFPEDDPVKTEQVRRAAVVERHEDGSVTVVWERTMIEETFSAEEWSERKRQARKEPATWM